MSDEHGLCPVRTTIRLCSGRYFDLADPKPDQFTLADIAAGLSKICRYNGQIDRFYSVAEHSVWCAIQAAVDGHPTTCVAATLMHDSPEAFVGDVCRPLKRMLSNYADIERRAEAVIWGKYDLPTEFGTVVAEIDNAMLIAEKRVMFSRDDVVWQSEANTRTLITPFAHWTPAEAQERFLEWATRLGIKD